MCCSMLQLTGREIRDLASDLADEMEEAKDYQRRGQDLPGLLVRR